MTSNSVTIETKRRRRREMTRYYAFAGYMSREKAEKHLIELGRVGAYLFCAPNDGTMVLSHFIQSDSQPVQHYNIGINDCGQLYLNANQPFGNFGELIDYYKNETDDLYMPLGKAAGIDDWEIVFTDVERSQKIGRGSVANVFRGKWGTYEVALKISRSKCMDSNLSSELDSIKKLNHKNVVTFFGGSKGRPAMMVLEYLPNGDLEEHIKQNRGFLAEFDLINICYQVCRGLSYMEHMQLIHDDIHIANFLVDGEHPCVVVKLTDFGHVRDATTDAGYSLVENIEQYSRLLVNVFTLATRNVFKYVGWKDDDTLTQSRNIPAVLSHVFNACRRYWLDGLPSFITLEKKLAAIFFTNEMAQEMYKLFRDVSDDEDWIPQSQKLREHED